MFDIPGADIHREKLEKFQATFLAFSKIVSGTFGCVLDPAWKSHLAEFKRLYKKLELPITPKV